MANEMTSAPEMTPAHEMTPAPLQYRSVGVRFVALLIDVIIAGIIASVFATPLQTPVSIARILLMEPFTYPPQRIRSQDLAASYHHSSCSSISRSSWERMDRR